jgi:hypothetical protein
MRKNDQLQKKPAVLKRVLDENASDSAAIEYTPLKKSTGFSFVHLRKELVKKLDNNDLATLEATFKQFLPKIVAQFFEAEYPAIFHWLLIDSGNADAFEFLFNQFSKEIWKDRLRENNFLFLTSFLNSRAGMASLGLLSPQTLALDVERFKILLTIDAEGVISFMEKNKEACFVKPSWQSYESALKSCNFMAHFQLK